jgi:perosamine synthetase
MNSSIQSIALNRPLNPAERPSFLCRPADGLFAVIEKCLSNGMGSCLVVDDDQRPVGRINLDDIRSAVRDGRLATLGSLGSLMATAHAGSAGQAPGTHAVEPVLDADGRLIDIALDRSLQYVQIARPDISNLEFRLLLDAFLSTWISSSGDYLVEFQKQFAALLGCSHAIAVSNGAAALHLALEALEIGEGDEVIVPDLTFAATINAVLHSGATPVIVDIDRLSWGMDVKEVRRALTARTRAIMPVHLYGRAAEMGPLEELAKEHGIAIVEDCAEALGARYEGRQVGQFGDVGCFSFFANKTITTGEGGMCVTNSDALAARLAELRDHGMTPGRRYWHERVGFNYRMTNLQAAIGVGQLARFEEIVARNRRIEALYREHFGDLPGVEFPPIPPNHVEPAIWLVSVQVPVARRKQLIDAAASAGIEVRPFFYSLSTMPAYESFGRHCPNSLALSRTGLNLPTSNAVDAPVVKKLAHVFSEVLA